MNAALVITWLVTVVTPAPMQAQTADPAESARKSTLDASMEIEQPLEIPDTPAFSIDSPIGPIEYRSMRGLRIGETGFNIGGFTTIEMNRAEGRRFEAELDGISFLVLWEPIDSFRTFAELEIGDLAAVEAGRHVRSSPTLEIERLYGELSLSDPINLRFGKFQTPIGRYNLVPAEPFVATAVDPVMIDTVFDEHQTGLTLSGTLFPLDGALDYWLYGQLIDPLDPSDDPQPANRSVGGRLQFTQSLEGWSVGASLLATEIGGSWSTLAGLDVEYRIRRFELTSEFVYQNGKLTDRDITGVYVQGQLEMLRDFGLVARYEHFNRIGSKREDAHIGDLGFVWRPRPWLVLLATYRFASRETDDVRRGLSSSISVVF